MLFLRKVGNGRVRIEFPEPEYVAAAIFVAVKGAIYKGSLRVGTVTSSTLAKRIVRLLNRYPANEKGV
jgi:hypothetical protein